MAYDIDARYKIMLVGDRGVGKSCLTLRYADDIFSDAYIPSIGVDFKLKTMMIKGKTVKLQIWDTAKEERFRTSSGSMYRGSNAIIIVFDLTNEASFRNFPHWIEEIDRYVDSGLTMILLAGNKVDLDDERVIDREAAKDMAKRYEEVVDYVEVSAKTGYGVEAMFKSLATKVFDKNNVAKKNVEEDYTTNIVSTARNTSERECCNIS